ncbi:zinc-binding dehydrogenase [Kocuria sp.]|uniref:zinc-binding dehydrogenase n=1 Tax=Kocuria sp. TaxID=1871328 RepID=UPI002898885E|nr:zinc-binding dehydrogenase [Kocuria sp.]
MDIHAYVVNHVDAPFRWEELTVDEPGPGEAVVKIVATGLCHTDLNTQAGNMPLPLPGVLGHEGAGIVTKIGAGVENVVVDESVPLELAGPLACGITTGAGAVLNTANPGPGESVVVYGVGAVGLGAIMAARNSAAATIIAVDLHDSRLELAQRYGATHVINSGKEDSLERIREITGGAADYAIECTGVIAVLEEAIEAIGMLGTCLLIGGAPTDARFSADHMRTLFGKRIVGTLGGSRTSQEMIPALLALWKVGRFPFDELVRTYPMAEIEQTIRDTRSGEVIKAVLILE